MALSNAERQRRFIQKLKSTAVTNETDALRQRIAELEAEVERLRNQTALVERVEWEAIDDDGEIHFEATFGPYVLFCNPYPDCADVSWWIGEDRNGDDDDEDLVNVAEGEAATLAIAKTDAEATARKMLRP